MTLNELAPGEQARIIDLHLDGFNLQRMLDMGFIEGEKVRMIRNAPLLDPIDVKIKGYMAAIRRSEARYIEIEVI
jgi:ferrous iron transport protein A